jgi:TRAP-type transport system periplasmic protein
MKPLYKVLSAAVLALALGPTSAFAATVIKLAHLNNDDPFNNPAGAMASVFKNLVETGTNGEVKVELFPNGQLGSQSDVMQQVRSGVIQSSIMSEGGMASAYPMIGVVDMPFAFPSINTAFDVFNGPFGKTLAKDIEGKTGLMVLGFGNSGGFFDFTNSKHPVHSPADMKGLKIRTMSLETQKALVASLGAQPVNIPWSGVYTALQTGVADGQMNPVPIISFAKLYQVQKYLTLSQHLFAPYVWVMNKQAFAKLTPEQQRVVRNAAQAAVIAGWGVAMAIEASDRGMPLLKKHMEVYSPTAAQLAEFRDASQPAVRKVIVEKFGKPGEALLNQFMAAIKQAEIK